MSESKTEIDLQARIDKLENAAMRALESVKVADGRSAAAEAEAILSEVVSLPEPEPVKVDYTREELIELCERARVPQGRWCNRDSEMSQRKIGELWALLCAGCRFEVLVDDEILKTDHKTIWVRTWSEGFSYFEHGEDEYLTKDQFYVPTPVRIEETDGGDWY